MTRREPDWADEAAFDIGLKCGLDCLASDEEHALASIAAALRAERERCAGIADQGEHEYPIGEHRLARLIASRIRAGDQP